MARLRAFDAARAQCFKPEDRDRLLSIIESGYGDFGEFNRVVRRAFELRLDTRHSMQNLFGENGQQSRSRWRVGSRRDATHPAHPAWHGAGRLVRGHEPGQHAVAVDVVRVRGLTKETVKAAAELWRRERLELCTELRGVALRSVGLEWPARRAVRGARCDLPTRCSQAHLAARGQSLADGGPSRFSAQLCIVLQVQQRQLRESGQ